MSFPIHWAENADTRCFLLRKHLGDLFDNIIPAMEDFGFQRYLLKDRARWAQRRLDQDLLYIFHIVVLVGHLSSQAQDLRQMGMEFLDKIGITEVASKLEKGQQRRTADSVNHRRVVLERHQKRQTN